MPYAFWTLEHLLEHNRIVPEQLLATFASCRIFGIGHTVAAACEPPALAGLAMRPRKSSAGNGALNADCSCGASASQIAVFCALGRRSPCGRRSRTTTSRRSLHALRS